MERAAEATRSAAATLPYEYLAFLGTVFQDGSTLFVASLVQQRLHFRQYAAKMLPVVLGQ
jgi:hypothetical protein